MLEAMHNRSPFFYQAIKQSVAACIVARPLRVPCSLRRHGHRIARTRVIPYMVAELWLRTPLH